MGAASANQDEELALAGANALVGGAKVGSREGNQAGSSAFAKATADKAPPTTSASATFIEASRVAAAFMKGQPLLETVGYKVHAGRRVGPGHAEIHTLDTDVIYVVDGSATLVTVVKQ